MQRKSTEFEAKQELEREKEMTDTSLATERLNLQQDALADKTRVAEDRIQTQRDIAAINAQMKGVRQ
jgi:multidrug efflux pump subunit AcrA (membrane-fusion protein)